MSEIKDKQKVGNDMTYKELYDSAVEKLDRNLITLGEYEKMLEPLDDEIMTAELKWIPVTERLPKINQLVILSSSRGRVYIGSRDKPDIIWQVTESDGEKLWVYDPESYDCDIDILPKNEDCGFSSASCYGEDCWLSATSPNCDLRFEAIIAWQPLPEPYKESDGE